MKKCIHNIDCFCTVFDALCFSETGSQFCCEYESESEEEKGETDD